KTLGETNSIVHCIQQKSAGRMVSATAPFVTLIENQVAPQKNVDDSFYTEQMRCCHVSNNHKESVGTMPALSA
ncbi:MAG: hypothetical protein AAF126_14325, partial [Chloroflexota bacterium]